MALLQISEPGQSPDPHGRRLAIGIDLGTTHSLVAAVRSSVPEVLPDENGAMLVPSVVRYRRDGPPQVGSAALAHAADDPLNTIVSVKRFMGRSAREAAAISRAYRFREGEGMVRLETVAGAVTPVEVSAEILRSLHVRARESLGGDIAGAVITVPAYFDDAQRQATKDAARLAGLEVLRLINEPTAAALAYGLDSGSEGLYAVYDLGGGTFDLSVLRLTQGVFEVVSTGGDSALGGDDFDKAIVDWALAGAGFAQEQVEAVHWRALLQRARACKEALSDHDSAPFEITLDDGLSIRCTLTRERFESLTRALLDRTLAVCAQALEDARLEASDVQGVVLVGGATRMPQVVRAAAAFFGSPPLRDIDPDKVVALGAALQANQLVGNSIGGDDWLLLDVIPLSLGIETMGGLVEKLIPRNSTIPVARAQEFTTYKDGQTAMAVHVLQGERELVDDCRSLARFELRGIPPMAAGAARIRVTFEVDADGLLSVNACETTSGVRASIAVKPSYGLGDDEIAQMLQSAFASAETDMTARALREQQVEADRLLEAIHSALAEDGDLLESAERDALDSGCRELAGLRETGHADSLRDAIHALSLLSEPFAARRMDRSVARALAGRSVDEL
ncbi:MAG: Fe-S protein assembly chaperone HscA [Burkholderiaceae bacterium]